MEADAGCVRLLDYINKRPINAQTSMYPLISTVVVVPEGTDGEILANIRAVGDANMFIKLPTSSASAFAAIIEVLQRRKAVETTFRDLKDSQVVAAKYPFLPIFGSSRRHRGGEDDAPHDLHDSVKLGNKAEESPTFNLYTNDIPDDWTDCSSIHPEFVKRLRKKERTKLPAHPLTMSKEERLLVEIRERHIVDKIILRNLNMSITSGARHTTEIFNDLSSSDPDSDSTDDSDTGR
jgi:hypothetical protein